VPNDRFGVASSHLSFYEPDQIDEILDRTASAGIGWVRCSFAWSDLEPVRGEWHFDKADMVVGKALARGIKVLGIMGASPPWANGGNPWNYPPTDLEAWTIYTWTVSQRYRGYVAAWEIGNEENIPQFWMPEPNPGQYVQLLGLASPAIRYADPGVKVVMGGVAGLDPQYLDDCLNLGAADYIDAIAYHPYPETLEEDNYTPQESRCRDIVGFVHWLVSEHTSKDLEIWITELGWTTCPESPPGVSEETQASYMLRSFINYAGTDVDRVFWYNLNDEYLNEHDYYGLLRQDMTSKLSYPYYANFNACLTGALPTAPGTVSFVCSRPETLEAHSFTLGDEGLTISAWKSDDAGDSLDITLADYAYGEPVTVDPLTGGEEPTPGVTRDENGCLTVSSLGIGKTPVILRFARLHPPHIFTLAPTGGAAGAVISVKGFGFGSSRGSSRVYFGTAPSTVYSSWADDEVRCAVPPGTAGEVAVRVVAGESSSNEVPFRVFAVTSVTPDYGVQNTTVEVSNLAGAEFETGATVRLERSGSPTINAENVTVVSSSKITCRLNLTGAPLARYDVVVRNPDGGEARLVQRFRVTDACGGGAGASLSLFAGMMGLLSLAGVGIRSRTRCNML
jgi:hypothetical protein